MPHVHFPQDTTAADIGWKSLAVNLSDLAAMGAQPAWCTLSLSLPGSDAGWIDAFLDGFLALAQPHGIALVGGDTTRGPLSIAVTAMGWVEPGRALRRDGAQADDDIWVTGTIGDAAAALATLDACDAALRSRLDRPTPRVRAGLALAGLAHACVDVSDGLLADLGHVCARSGVGAEIDIDALPASPMLLAFAPAHRRVFQASGGDDYELCFTAPAQRRDEVLRACADVETPVARVGRIVVGEGIHVMDGAGRPWQPVRMGYDHFRED